MKRVLLLLLVFAICLVAFSGVAFAMAQDDNWFDSVCHYYKYHTNGHSCGCSWVTSGSDW